MSEDLALVLSESQAEGFLGVGCIATNTVILNQGVLLGGLFKGLCNNTVPYNKISFVWSAKSQKLSQLELIGNIEML